MPTSTYTFHYKTYKGMSASSQRSHISCEIGAKVTQAGLENRPGRYTSALFDSKVKLKYHIPTGKSHHPSQFMYWILL